MVCLGSLVGPLDSSLNVGFPLMTTAFGIAVADIQWIVISFVIAQSSLTLVFGKIGDLYGHRRVFRLGMACCAVAHLACGFATSYPALIGLRVVQGVSIGLAMASAPALATLLFPPESKVRILALYVMLIGFGSGLGPLAGGLMLETTGWPGLFWFRVPIVMGALVLSMGLPDPPRSRTDRPRFDIAGAALLVASLASVILFVSIGRLVEASLGPRILLAVGAIVAITWFVRHESRVPEPILRIDYFRDRSFASIQLAAIAIHFATFSILLLGPYLLVGPLGLAPRSSGVMLALFPIGSIVAGAVAGRLARRIDPIPLMRGGLALPAVGLLLAAYAAGHGTTMLLVIAWLTIGVGLGLYQVGYMDLTTTILPASDRGVAGSLVNVTRLVGYVLGAALITALHEFVRDPTTETVGYQRTFLILGTAFVLGWIWFWRFARR